MLSLCVMVSRLEVDHVWDLMIEVVLMAMKNGFRRASLSSQMTRYDADGRLCVCVCVRACV